MLDCGAVLHLLVPRFQGCPSTDPRGSLCTHLYLALEVLILLRICAALSTLGGRVYGDESEGIRLYVFVQICIQ